ncbi:hypothetical protein C8J57DRAFT_1503832 [Mycena rebaudengoi]|nr:hypothetical protein C8J57DRAFT_1503832 [Mycena rebaudengoi]
MRAQDFIGPFLAIELAVLHLTLRVADQLPMHLLAHDHRGGARPERECDEDEGEMRERVELHSLFTRSDLKWDERWVPGWSAQSVLYVVG